MTSWPSELDFTPESIRGLSDAAVLKLAEDICKNKQIKDNTGKVVVFSMITGESETMLSKDQFYALFAALLKSPS